MSPKQGFAAIKPAASDIRRNTSSKLTNRLQESRIHPPKPETPLRTSTATAHCKSAKRGFSSKTHLEETNHGVCQLRKCAVRSVSETASPVPPLRTYTATMTAHLIAAKPPNLPDSMSPEHGFAAIKPATNRNTPRSTSSKRGFSRKLLPQEPANQDCQLRISAALLTALLIAAKPPKSPRLRPPERGFAAIKHATPPSSICSTLTNRLEGS